MAHLLRPRGFTLLEILAALVLLGVLSSLAAPSLRDAVHRARLDAALRALTGEVYRARALAARSGRPVRIRFEPGEGGCLEGYALEDALAGARIRRVDLRREAPGVCVTLAGSPHLLVNPRGMPSGAARRVRARIGDRTDSLTISLVGRIYR